MKKKNLNQKNFQCSRCGECCKFKVKLTAQEIKSIQDLGYKKADFLETDKTITKINGNCFFLRYSKPKKTKNTLTPDKNLISECIIYKNRPKICREYPFNQPGPIPSCKPANNSIFIKTSNAIFKKKEAFKQTDGKSIQNY